jgi:uncharacterized phiE125 gp8 family phage protein
MEGIHWGLALVAAPAVEPITLEEGKLHLRVDSSTEDELITTLIRAARHHAEGFLGQRLISSTWSLTLDQFPVSDACPILLPYPPLSSVSTITYLDEDGVSQTWSSSDYIVDTRSVPGRITPAYEAEYPETQDRINAVTIQYVAGYGSTPQMVPADIIAGMKLLIGHLYENREASVIGTIVNELPFAVNALWSPHRVYC